MDGTVELVGVGNALVDVIAFSDEDVAEPLGLRPNEAVHVDSGRFSELAVALPNPSLSAGGGAAGTVKIASRLGIRSAFVGRVGSKAKGGADRFAVLFEKEMRDAGVLPVLSRGPEPTGGCLVIRMPGGRFAIAASPSAAVGLGPEEIPEDLVKAAKVLVLDGYLLGREKLVERALELAERYGTAVALDAGSRSIAAAFAPFISRLAANAPLILFMNESEALAHVSALRSSADMDDEDAFDHLRAMTEAGPFPIVVVKRGPLGSVVFAGGSRFDAATRAVDPRDETGAGDVFAAGFLAGWIRDKPLSECAALGNRVARETVSVPGTRIPPAVLRRLANSLR
jgi:sugar/nucleoside kinase (ribokinase family)